jgi:hypothetical protein
MKKLSSLFLAVCLLLVPICAQAAGTPDDGPYTIEAALIGGSGRASVASPAELTIKNGVATVRVVWSSPYYEYMLVGGKTYYPVQKEGNSTFEIPVTLDTNISFSAQTVAMSRPHLIEYTLRFDCATLKPLQSGPAATDILIGGLFILALILAGAALVITRRGRPAEKDKIP